MPYLGKDTQCCVGAPQIQAPATECYRESMELTDRTDNRARFNHHRRRTMTGLACLALGLSVAACTPKTALRGNAPREGALAKLQVGVHRKADVEQLLGSPSVLGTFDSNVWYYMSRKTEQWAFFEPDVVEQQVLAVYFDDQDVLQHMQTYTEDDARDIAYSDRITPTAGNKLGFFEQIFGNLGKGNKLGN